MFLNQFLLLAAILFCIGVYGVLARKNGVLVLMSIELILNAVNINLVAFGAYWNANDNTNVSGQVFALFVIAVAAADEMIPDEPLQVPSPRPSTRAVTSSVAVS
jgi:NADH:ubiquinone oxidoreductase subunit K